METENNQSKDSKSKAKNYKTVNIGNQEWTAENLDVSHYRNGDVIPEVQDSDEWEYLTTGAWCYYENDAENGKIYGKLYNWHAVNDPRGLAPKGFHIPSDEEWTQLTEYLGGKEEAGGKLKSKEKWESPNAGAVNGNGFSALPGGSRYSIGSFDLAGKTGHYWTSNEFTQSDAWCRNLSNTTTEVVSNVSFKNLGLSVRCVRGKISLTSAKSDKTSKNKKGNRTGWVLLVILIVIFILLPIVLVSYLLIGEDRNSEITEENKKKLTENFILKEETIKEYESAKEEVKIGKQVWMGKNLNVDRYRNGDVIPQVQDAKEWSKLTTGAWCYYENESKNGKIFGKLYNWYAVNDPRGLAPKGWHIPSDKEWTQLTDYLGGEKIAGIKLKSTTGWKDKGNGTNESGFNAFPGGYRGGNGYFVNVGIFANFWSASEGSYDNARGRWLKASNSDVTRNGNGKENGFSIRCIRD